MSRQPPAFLQALGRQPLPGTVAVRGKRYRVQRVFKNDFFAVTAMYEAEGERVLVKIGRTAGLFVFPMKWLGRLLAAREAAALRRLQDLPGVPHLLDRCGPTGIVREFVEGHPLAKGERVPDDFHERLRQLVGAMHERGMAYVDLEKCENVLVGDDGRPYCIDFQICWYWPKRWGGELWPVRVIRGWFQTGDLYHLCKLKRRTRPDQMTPKERASSYRKPWYVYAHRAIARPFTLLRRAVLNRIDPRRAGGERGRVAT